MCLRIKRQIIRSQIRPRELIHGSGGRRRRTQLLKAQESSVFDKLGIVLRNQSSVPERMLVNDNLCAFVSLYFFCI